MRERFFRFKQFSVLHKDSAMKVGVDSVLLGAWARVEDSVRVLDAGCGCGLLALMVAQRNPSCRIMGIDIHRPSVEEARKNFETSPWGERLTAEEADFSQLEVESKYDLIISNPPFFNSGVEVRDTGRLASRHVGTLSPAGLILRGKDILIDGGRIAMISPYSDFEALKSVASEHGMYLQRCCAVSSFPGREPKRMMSEWTATPTSASYDNLTLKQLSEEPTDDYRKLCFEFYPWA